MTTTAQPQTTASRRPAAIEFCRLVVGHRHLIAEMTRRTLIDQYAGQVLGKVWAVMHPLLFAGIYIFVFAFVFSSSFGDGANLPLDRPAFILAGLVPWMGLIRSMSLGSVTLLANANLVKQVVFPIEVLPVKDALASFFGQVVSLVALLLYVLLRYGLPAPTIVLLPLLFVVQFALMVGLAFLLASLTPFFRDLQELITVFSQIGIFTLPVVFMPPYSPVLNTVLHLNPFSYMVWCYQDVLFYGRIEHPLAWIVFPLLSLVVLSIGYRVFMRMKMIVGNVL